MRRTNGGIATLVSLVVTAALTSACSGPAEAEQRPAKLTAQATGGVKTQVRAALGGSYTAQDVLDMYEQDQGLRLALPVTLPDGYVFLGFLPPDVRKTRTGEQIVARKAWFDLGQETAMVCAELVRIKGEVCPETNIDVEHTQNGLYRNVSVETPVSNDTYDWGQATYTSDPTKWTWLPQ